MAWTLQTSPGTLARTGSGTSITPTCTSSTEGTALIAVLSSSSGSNVWTLPTGWLKAADEKDASVYYYPGNPGGITSVLCQSNGTNTLTAAIAEFNPNGAGVYANLAATGSTTSADALTVTTSSDPNSGDLGICSFNFSLATAATVAWTTPASWTLIADYTASGGFHSSGYYYIGVPSNAPLAVEGEVATTQNNLYGCVATFSLVPAASVTGAVTLSATATGTPHFAAAKGGGAAPAVLLAAGLID